MPPPPPITAPVAALTGYAATHHHAMLIAAWLEGTGTLLQIIFVLALAHLAGVRACLAGQITTVACAAVLGVSLLYDVMLIATAQSAALGGRQTTTALVANGPFAAVERVFLVARPCPATRLILLCARVLPRHAGGEIGYVLNPSLGGRGYATEAVAMMLRLGFEELGLHRIIARIDERNEPSARLPRRVGMRQEARLVDNEFFKGEWTTGLDFAMLADEWYAAHSRHGTPPGCAHDLAGTKPRRAELTNRAANATIKNQLRSRAEPAIPGVGPRDR